MCGALLYLATAVFVADGAAAQPPVSALCPGQSFPLEASSSTPHIVVARDGVPGTFLLDYGATRSTLWTHSRDEVGRSRRATVALPGVSATDFILRYDDGPIGPDSPAGILGTDVLSRLTVQLEAGRAIISDRPCDGARLVAAGFRAIDQEGFFAATPDHVETSHANVPVLFLRFGETRFWAQIDTGYADVAHSRSIDINAALHRQIDTSALHADGTISVATCEGAERRPAYRLAGDITVEDSAGAALRTIATPRLVLKPANRCGGIAMRGEPAAQIGASVLHALGTMIFDPRAHRIWIRPRN